MLFLEDDQQAAKPHKCMGQPLQSVFGTTGQATARLSSYGKMSTPQQLLCSSPDLLLHGSIPAGALVLHKGHTITSQMYCASFVSASKILNHLTVSRIVTGLAPRACSGRSEVHKSIQSLTHPRPQCLVMCMAGQGVNLW